MLKSFGYVHVSPNVQRGAAAHVGPAGLVPCRLARMHLVHVVEPVVHELGDVVVDPRLGRLERRVPVHGLRARARLVLDRLDQGDDRG